MLDVFRAFVYTSTAYSNCNRSELVLEEKVYRLPIPTKLFLAELETVGDENLEFLVSQCTPKWPNAYSFSKCLAENVVIDNVHDLPIVIVRPSVILSAWKGSMPGFTEENSAFSLFMQGMGKGFVRVFNCDPNTKLDFLPVDVVANAHVVSAWSVATKRNSSPLVINCTATTEALKVKTKDFIQKNIKMTNANPMPNSYQIPTSVKILQFRLLYWWNAIIDHYAPALVLDFALRLSGRKPRLVALYKLYDKSMTSINFFLTNEWAFANDNFRQLDELMDADEKKMLCLNLGEYELDFVMANIPNSSPFYLWKRDKKTVEERMRTMKKNYIRTELIRYMVLILHLLVLCIASWKMICVIRDKII